MKINSVIPVCKEKNDFLINENSFDDYILNSLYNDDLEKEELIEETELIGTVFRLSEVNTQEEEKAPRGLF